MLFLRSFDTDRTQVHQGHICALASEGKFEDIKCITKKPHFICFNCGRVADSDKNVCNPMPLK